MHPFEVVRCALRLLNVQRLQSLRVCGVAVPGAGISLATRCGKFTILLLNKCKNSPLVKKNPLPAHSAHSLPLRCCTSCVLFKFLETGFKYNRGRGFRAGDWGLGSREAVLGRHWHPPLFLSGLMLAGGNFRNPQRFELRFVSLR